MTNKDVYSKVAKNLNISESTVEQVYRSYWKFIRHSLKTLPFSQTYLSQQEFDELRTSINIPSLGKLYCTYPKYIGLKKRFQLVQKLHNQNEDKED